jgi:glucuronokinase
MEKWAGLTEKFRESMERGDSKSLHELININFDLRRSLVPISKGNIEMVELARSVGASAKFTGSGGAIIGTYDDEKMFEALCKKLEKNGIEVIKPIIVK